MYHFYKLITFINLSLSSLLIPSTVLAQTAEPIGQTCVRDGDGNIRGCYSEITQLEQIFANILNVITVLAGFAVLLMLVIGAFRYMTAQGDPKAVGAARSTLTWALVGLFFIIAAWFVILFISQFTGLNLTEFCINLPFDIDRCELQIDS